MEKNSLILSSLMNLVRSSGITLEPSRGNPPPRIVETPAGMLNAIGLQNVGVDQLISEKLPYLRQFDLPVIVNINGRR